VNVPDATDLIALTSRLPGRRGLRTMVLMLVFLAPLVFAHGDLVEQIDALTARISAEPNNAELYFRRAELYREHEQWPAAAADYDRFERLAPAAASVHLGRAKLLQAMDLYPAAQTELDKFLLLQPGNVDALVTRARGHEHQGQHVQAAEDFAAAIAHAAAPEPAFYLERAQALVAADPRHPELALACLDQGQERLGPLPTLGLAAIALEVDRGHYDDALARLDQMSAGAQRQEAWLERRGDIQAKAGRREQALHAYGEAQQALADLPIRLRGSQSMQEMSHRLEKKIISLN
jgi:tetratricopeptide (TPR) repeat protein